MGWHPTRFARELRKVDALLRLRRSVDPRWWLIERKCAHGSPCLVKPRERQGWDRYTANRDGYTLITKVPWDRLNHEVFLQLREWDMWTYGGGGPAFDRMMAMREKEEALEDRRETSMLSDCAREAYDLIRHKEHRIEAGFHPKTVNP